MATIQEQIIQKFEIWFYLAQHFLNIDWVMKHVHHVPPPLLSNLWSPLPSRKTQSILQGPMGHFMCTLAYLINPLIISAAGFLISIYALLAHDGRSLDLNDHTYHHYYHECKTSHYIGASGTSSSAHATTQRNSLIIMFPLGRSRLPRRRCDNP